VLLPAHLDRLPDAGEAAAPPLLPLVEPFDPADLDILSDCACVFCLLEFKWRFSILHKVTSQSEDHPPQSSPQSIPEDLCEFLV
jgi:hypothetical protein